MSGSGYGRGLTAQRGVRRSRGSGVRRRGVGDLDGDGKADIVWHHARRASVVWPMNGTTRLDQVWVATVPDVGYRFRAWRTSRATGKRTSSGGTPHRRSLDLDDERHCARGRDVGVHRAGDGLPHRRNSDYNGDGKADLLWHHATAVKCGCGSWTARRSCRKPGSPRCPTWATRSSRRSSGGKPAHFAATDGVRASAAVSPVPPPSNGRRTPPRASPR